jgi:hypothetical protein
MDYTLFQIGPGGGLNLMKALLLSTQFMKVSIGDYKFPNHSHAGGKLLRTKAISNHVHPFRKNHLL